MRLFRALSLLLFAVCLHAQAASRNVLISWTASTSTSVTGYAVYSCIVPSGANSCTPSVTGAPLASTASTSVIVSEQTGAAYGFSVVAQAPACTGTSSLTSSCGNSAPVTVNYAPVPPQTPSGSNVVIVVP